MSTSPVARRACASHPERPAAAACRGCRRALCLECSTEWEGIHLCARCVAERRAAVKTESSWATLLGLALSGAALLFLTPRLMVWVGGLFAGTP